jgi:F-type H+-transporting ATPase subunit delta
LISVVKAMLENSDLETLRLSTRLFETKIGEEFSVCIVDVTTAVELDDNLRSLIKDKVKNELGMDAILHETQDKSIVGGIIMSVNGKCIDASMITQLNHARSVLKAS